MELSIINKCKLLFDDFNIYCKTSGVFIIKFDRILRDTVMAVLHSQVCVIKLCKIVMLSIFPIYVVFENDVNIMV